MANAKIISFVDHQINAVVDAAFDAMAVELDDLGIELRDNFVKSLEQVEMLCLDQKADTRLLQRAIQQLREDVDRLQQGGGSPPQ